MFSRPFRDRDDHPPEKRVRFPHRTNYIMDGGPAKQTDHLYGMFPLVGREQGGDGHPRESS